MSLRDDAVVSLDGYAVAFRAEDLPTEPFTITFSYQTENGIVDYPSQQYTKEAASGDNKALLEVKNGDFYLAPLPDKLIDSKYAADKFYQQLGFQVGTGTTTWAAYCPHFAKTEFPLEGTTPEERAKEIEDEWQSGRAYAVRTPRHLRALSQFEVYYSAGQRYTFRQELDLDYKTYTGYDWDNSWDEGKKYTQVPIGRSDKPFNGVYDGGYHTIKGVRFTLPEGSSRQYAGLFGLSIDTLKNIVYLMDPEDKIPVATGTGLNLYLGGLAGGNSGTIDNCAVAGANLEGKVYSSATASAGGLVGHNMGTIQNSAADVKLLYTESSGYAHSLAGGLVGMNDSGATVTDSYAVGHVSAKVDSTSDARVCGFVGRNAGSVTSSYAAVWLESSGAGVETYGFCGEKMGSQQNTHFLNEGNFEYRTQPYNASYAIRSETKAKPIVYKKLTSQDSPLLSQGSKMKLGGKAIDGNPGETMYPYPTGVTRIENGETVYVHYGQWPAELNLGEMGVYYWEKLSLPTGELDQDGKELRREVYGVSMLAVKPDKANDGTGTVSKLSTLSNARSDGGVVVDYGYGYYYVGEAPAGFSTEGISYTENGAAGKEWKNHLEQTNKEKEVDDKLAALMPGYTFHSYHSFVPNPDPKGTENPADGLYATGAKDSAPNGTVTLTGKDNGVTATFEVNPHFADALSISKAPDNYTVSDNNLKISPGTNEGNPYEVRAVGQLSAINWNSTKRDTKTVMVGENREMGTGRTVKFSDNTKQFLYLSRSSDPDKDNGRYFWKQTHDINGNGGVYTPIAEYYTIHKSGKLNGWFGGSFDGDDYVIENVNIQGQTSSVAGLFGVVLDGTLKNIVLYSSDGKGYVTADFDTDTMLSVDYYMGTLAGLAATTAGNTTATIKNCSASGYTINYKTYNVIDNKLGVGQQPGGSGVGGLLGASYMALENCSAVTTIRILANEKNLHGNDNTRVGGLVGIAKRSITNCYAGGEITVGGTLNPDGSWNKDGGTVRVKALNGLFLGGIMSGNYFEAIGSIGGGNNDIALSNCYSYVKLPSQSETKIESTTTQAGVIENGKIKTEETYIRGLYVMGGIGDGTDGRCTITNCYYLESEVMRNNRNGFNVTTTYKGGSGEGNDRKAFQLKTDIPTINTSARVIENGTKKDITLSPSDVGRTFMVDCRRGGGDYGFYTRGTVAYHTLETHGVNLGVPVFVADSNHGNSHEVTFSGWKIYAGDGNFDVVDDPVKLSDPMPLNYAQLAGSADITRGPVTQRIYKWLPAYSPVTATEGKFDIPGKYSYSSDPKLEGLDYPFPTILTREGGTLHVHYGNWPLNGIERKENGGAPITLNLLGINRSEEVLSLSEGVKPGGTWKVEEVLPGNETLSIAAPKLDRTEDTDGTCELSVTGNRVGQTTVRVTYTEPGAGGRSYPLDITVYVTATLRVAPKPSPIYVYPGSLTKVPLVLCDEQGQELEMTEELRENLLIHEMTAGNPPKQLQAVNIEKDKTDDTYYLVLRAAGETPKDEAGNNDSTGLLTVAVDYRYGQDSGEEDVWDNYTSTLTIEMLELPEPEPTEDGSTQIKLPAGEKNGIETVVTEVKVDGDKITQTTPETGATDPADPAKPEATWVGDIVTLKNYTPGSDVTLALKLETRRSDAAEGEQPTTHEVTMTVTIPEAASAEAALSELSPEEPLTGEALPEAPQTEEVPAEEIPAEEPPTEETPAEETPAEEPPAEEVPAEEPPAENPALKTSEGNTMEPLAEPEEAKKAELPEGPDPALPVEGKTDPVPEKDAGAGEDETEPKQ